MSLEQEMTIGQIGQMVCRDLPPEWQLQISLEEGAGFVRLMSPEGGAYDFCLLSESTLEEAVIEAVNFAKTHREEFE